MIRRRRAVALLVVVLVLVGLVWGVRAAAGLATEWLGDEAAEDEATEADAPAEEQTAPPQPGPCAPRDLDVTLEPQHGSGGTDFALTLLNARGSACLVDVGSANLAMTVHSGEDRVWASADCPSGPEEHPLLLARGDRTQTVVTWDGRRSEPGCSGDRQMGGSGTYRVETALDGVALPTAEASFTR
ncbi:hypothetical protein [Georgenia deserti]|uniref:hypothetical protein n=1 Tax=Georgenia deserti TaxID=2093781 RepID=UPI0036DEE3F5